MQTLKIGGKTLYHQDGKVLTAGKENLLTLVWEKVLTLPGENLLDIYTHSDSGKSMRVLP